MQKQTQIQIATSFCTNWTFAGNTMITGKIACRDHLTVGTEKLRNGYNRLCN